MRLVVKRADQVVKEFHFDKGPIYIGRHVHSQVFLSDEAVSRQHAVIFTAQDGRWMVEDLDSANKTYLNDQPIQKTQIKDGDILRIVDFTIEVDLKESAAEGKPIHLEDTLAILLFWFEAAGSERRARDLGHAIDLFGGGRPEIEESFVENAHDSVSGTENLVDLVVLQCLVDNPNDRPVDHRRRSTRLPYDQITSFCHFATPDRLRG